MPCMIFKNNVLYIPKQWLYQSKKEKTWNVVTACNRKVLLNSDSGTSHIK